LSGRLIDKVITVTLVLFAVSRVIGRNRTARSSWVSFTAGWGLVAFITRDLVEAGDRLLDAGLGVRRPSDPAVVQYPCNKHRRIGVSSGQLRSTGKGLTTLN
jgi:hypothetical protein